jgi:hypothetical protein
MTWIIDFPLLVVWVLLSSLGGSESARNSEAASSVCRRHVQDVEDEEFQRTELYFPFLPWFSCNVDV